MPPVGFRHSDETRAKMSASQRGHSVSNETRVKIGAASLGRQPSAETRAKISARARGRDTAAITEAARIANTGRRHSEATRVRMSAAQRGHLTSDEARAKMSASAKRRGAPMIAAAAARAANLGRRTPDVTRAKLSRVNRASPKVMANMVKLHAAQVGRIGVRGARHPNWRGGSIDRRDGDVGRVRLWKRAVHRRDDNICQWCSGSTDGGKRNRIADHIIPWKDAPELRYEIWNGRTLCRDCNSVRTGAQTSRRFAERTQLVH